MALFFVSCSVGEKEFSEATRRLDALREQDFPDSLISPISNNITNAKSSLKRHRSGDAKNSYKAAIVALEQAELIAQQNLTEKLPTLKSKLASQRSEADKSLTKLHLKAAQKLFHGADSLLNKKAFFTAEKHITKIDNHLADLAEQEERAKSLRKKVYGTWTFTQNIKNVEDKSVKAYHKKTFSFRKNGKASFIDEKKGKSASFLKEDWKFESYGTFDLKGDTVFLAVTQFNTPRFTTWAGDGKGNWQKNSQPTSKTTVTDGSQDRHIAFSTLSEEFKHRR